MLEMAILEIQHFKIFWGGMPPDPLRKLVPSALVGPPPPPPPFWKSCIRPVPISVLNTFWRHCIQIYAHTGSLKLYVTMLIGYAENDIHLHLSLSQCLTLLILKRLFFKNAVVKTAVTIQMWPKWEQGSNLCNCIKWKGHSQERGNEKQGSTRWMGKGKFPFI